MCGYDREGGLAKKDNDIECIKLSIIWEAIAWSDSHCRKALFLVSVWCIVLR